VRPLAVDLCCGLGGWTEGLLSEGWRVRGYDIEAHEYGDERYPGELVLKSILDLHGSEVADADLIVASPPCTEYSYMAMPWTRARQIARALRGEGDFPPGYKGSRTVAELNALFDACFRIQREASEAKGEPVPMVVENVKGAQPWVGPAVWAFGSYYLWGDVPALMPNVVNARKNPGFRFDGSGRSFQSESVNRHVEGMKNANGGSWFKIGSPGQKAVNNNPDGRQWKRDPVASCGSKSPKRKAASAKIAKIPFALSSYIGRVYLPKAERSAA
jgi:hypothetical protein